MALIERRETALRERYEAIYDKVLDTRNLLNRVDYAEPITSELKDPRDTNREASSVEATTLNEGDNNSNPVQAPAEDSDREIARRRLRVSGSLQNILQASEEVGGVAEAFDDLHDQLENNRIQNQDLKSRLREQIAQPLQRIASQRMPELAGQVELVEEHIEDSETGQKELAKSLVLADAILIEMRQVLERMLELESYNEAVALLRGIIADQVEINRQTKQRQSERLRSLLDDE